MVRVRFFLFTFLSSPKSNTKYFSNLILMVFINLNSFGFTSFWLCLHSKCCMCHNYNQFLYNLYSTRGYIWDLFCQRMLSTEEEISTEIWHTRNSHTQTASETIIDVSKKGDVMSHSGPLLFVGCQVLESSLPGFSNYLWSIKMNSLKMKKRCEILSQC